MGGRTVQIYKSGPLRCGLYIMAIIKNHFSCIWWLLLRVYLSLVQLKYLQI